MSSPTTAKFRDAIGRNIIRRDHLSFKKNKLPAPDRIIYFGFWCVSSALTRKVVRGREEARHENHELVDLQTAETSVRPRKEARGGTGYGSWLPFYFYFLTSPLSSRRTPSSSGHLVRNAQVRSQHYQCCLFVSSSISGRVSLP